jgi:hypothetical protein
MLSDGYQMHCPHKPEQSGADASAYYHEFLVLGPLQVLPCYVVQFDMGPEDAVALCDVCGQRPAVVFCAADNARLCAEDDDETHTANKLVARHVRVPLRDAPPVATCAEHGTNAEYFCQTCATVGVRALQDGGQPQHGRAGHASAGAAGGGVPRRVTERAAGARAVCASLC